VGFLRGAASPLPISYGVWGSTVSNPSEVQGGVPENFDFGAFWDLRNHIRMVS